MAMSKQDLLAVLLALFTSGAMVSQHPDFPGWVWIFSPLGILLQPKYLPITIGVLAILGLGLYSD